jgi:hypothetical protein
MGYLDLLKPIPGEQDCSLLDELMELGQAQSNNPYRPPTK